MPYITVQELENVKRRFKDFADAITSHFDEMQDAVEQVRLTYPSNEDTEGLDSLLEEAQVQMLYLHADGQSIAVSIDFLIARIDELIEAANTLDSIRTQS